MRTLDLPYTFIRRLWVRVVVRQRLARIAMGLWP
jgi:hypothetical protein